MDLNEIVVFVKVAQAGSFIKAANELGMPNSTVSARVSALEKRLGVTLLYRTTRKLSLTEEGERFFRTVEKNIAALRAAEEDVSAAQEEPQGLLRITAPPVFASAILPAALGAYRKAHPKVRIELIASDNALDLISENIDLAIRAGKLEDSSMIAKRLGESYFAPFASPEYLKKAPQIAHPRDLLAHPCLQFTPLGREKWSFTGRQKVDVSMPGDLLLNDLYTVRELVLKSQGVALLPTFLCDEFVREKRLVRVLPDWRSEVKPISFVYPAHKFVPPKLAGFIRVVGEAMKARLERCAL